MPKLIGHGRLKKIVAKYMADGRGYAVYGL